VRHLLAVETRNYRARIIIEITTKILLSIGICKAKWLKIDCESADKGRLDLPQLSASNHTKVQEKIIRS
jgi:hypothetical protein